MTTEAQDPCALAVLELLEDVLKLALLLLSNTLRLVRAPLCFLFLVPGHEAYQLPLYSPWPYPPPLRSRPDRYSPFPRTCSFSLLL